MSRARDLATFVSNADGDIRFDTDTLFVDSSANKVGIRTNTPPHPLSVFGTGSGNATVQIEGESGADPTINFLANNAQHWAIGIDDSDSDTFKISEHSALGTNDYLNIDVNGNVGVGISAPSSMLHLFDGGTDTGITLQSKVQASATSSITFMSRDSSNVNQNAVLKNVGGRFQSSTGIMFGSDTSELNAIDDYEEGTWSPGINHGSMSVAGAVYTKVGNLVTVTANVYNFSDRSSSNSVGINNLPYTSSSTGTATGSIIGRYIGHSGVGYSAYIGSSSGSVYFYENPHTADYHTMKHSDFASSSSADFHFLITYRT